MVICEITRGCWIWCHVMTVACIIKLYISCFCWNCLQVVSLTKISINWHFRMCQLGSIEDFVVHECKDSSPFQTVLFVTNSILERVFLLGKICDIIQLLKHAWWNSLWLSRIAVENDPFYQWCTYQKIQKWWCSVAILNHERIVPTDQGRWDDHRGCRIQPGASLEDPHGWPWQPWQQQIKGQKLNGNAQLRSEICF